MQETNENWPLATFHYLPQPARCLLHAPLTTHFDHFAPKLLAHEDWVGVERESKQMGPMATVQCILGCAPLPSLGISPYR